MGPGHSVDRRPGRVEAGNGAVCREGREVPRWGPKPSGEGRKTAVGHEGRSFQLASASCGSSTNQARARMGPSGYPNRPAHARQALALWPAHACPPRVPTRRVRQSAGPAGPEPLNCRCRCPCAPAQPRFCALMPAASLPQGRAVICRSARAHESFTPLSQATPRFLSLVLFTIVPENGSSAPYRRL